MKFNIFEGARRIALLCGLTVTAVVLWELSTYEPRLSQTYTIENVGSQVVKTDLGCPSDAKEHRFEVITRDLNRPVQVKLCFLASLFGENQSALIPYLMTKDGTVWGGTEYSSAVMSYVKSVEKNFVLPVEDELRLKKDYDRLYWDKWINGLKELAIGLLAFVCVVYSVGWIMRGFLGIPRGMDHRPD